MKICKIIVFIVLGVTHIAQAEEIQLCQTDIYQNRTEPFFETGKEITVDQLTSAITHLNKVSRAIECKKDNSLFKLESSYKSVITNLEKEIETKESSIKKLEGNSAKLMEELLDSPTQEKAEEIKGVRQTIAEQEMQMAGLKDKKSSTKQSLDALNTSVNKTKVKLNKLCLINNELNKENKVKCLTALHTELTRERENLVEFISDVKKLESISNVVLADLNSIEKLMPAKIDLEKSPSPKEILDKFIDDSGVMNANAKVIKDILDQRSTQIAIFRQKLKVLQRNTNIAIEMLKAPTMSCSVVSEVQKKTGFFSNSLDPNINEIKEKLTQVEKEIKKKDIEADNTLNKEFTALNEEYNSLVTLKIAYNNLSTSDIEFCEKLPQLEDTVKTTLNKTYDDSWFQNKNLEVEIDDIDQLLRELNGIITNPNSDPVETRAKRTNFMQHSQRFFAKYNATARFNVGLGLTMFSTPKLMYNSSNDILLEELLGPDSPSLSVEINEMLPDVQDLSPSIVITMAYLDLNLTIPNIDESYQTILPIQSISVEGPPPEDGQPALEPTIYLAKSTIDWRHKVDFDANLNIKVLGFLRENYERIPWFNKRGWFKDKIANFDLNFTRGRTHIELEQTINSELRQTTDSTVKYADLASFGSISNSNSINDTHSYKGWSFSYYVADQLKLDIYKKWYGKPPEGLKLIDDKVWGVTFSYLFF
ncbi:hypothetical protein J1N51_03415 [Psychrosphaera ytuae]|uniref:Uncharacterized protein n=1 Tax=Psychrosphaera ytuae TaxID=2820710 RepID=A0A975DCC0_9GAMM|nr:hypothetical protein [Psychrosphaera ytuae]QTH64535.1 hypothetical protein J1N51_03415 [Psychrosphaera ytuae]